MGKHKNSVDNQILGRIIAKNRGWVFTPADFLDLGSRTAVGLALMRHARIGTIRKLARGLYDYPVQDARAAPVPPSNESIANALKGRDDFRLQVSGAHAANGLGLSDQVPVRAVYLTDSRARKVKLGRREIVLKNTTTRQMATAGRISGTVMQALRWLGQRNVDERVVAKLRRTLSDSDKKQLLQDLRYASGWVAEIMRAIAQPPK